MGLPDGDAARFFVNARAGTTRKEGEKYINLFMGIRNIYYVGNEMDIIYTYYLSFENVLPPWPLTKRRTVGMCFGCTP
jgi:hypothetical protein